MSRKPPEGVIGLHHFEAARARRDQRNTQDERTALLWEKLGEKGRKRMRAAVGSQVHAALNYPSPRITDAVINHLLSGIASDEEWYATAVRGAKESPDTYRFALIEVVKNLCLPQIVLEVASSKNILHR